LDASVDGVGWLFIAETRKSFKEILKHSR